MDPDVAHVLRTRLPEHAARPAEPLGAGLDHVAWRVGDAVARRAHADGAVAREATLLGVVARRAPVPVPEVLAADADRGVLVHRFLPGVPLDEAPPGVRTRAADDLGRLVAALRATPAADVAGLVDHDDTPLRDWADEALALVDDLAHRLPAGLATRLRAALQTTPPDPPPGERLLSHDDLGAEHVLVDPATGSVTGVIDWSDAALADPAADLARLYRDMGPGFVARMRRAGALRGTPDEEARLRTIAACALVEDLAFAAGRGDAARWDRSLRRAAWTAPG